MATAPLISQPTTRHTRPRTRPDVSAPVETRSNPKACRLPGPIAERLVALADGIARSQRELVVAAAEFADSAEWVLAGWSSAAGWLAEACDVEPCTAREWIRIGHRQRSVKWRTEPDGMVTSTLRLPPLLAQLLIAMLTKLVMRTRPRREADGSWPTLAQQHCDAVEQVLTAGAGTIDTEIVLHIRGDGATCDDGTPIPDTVIADLAPDAFLRALIHDAEGRPINASHLQRHPTARQKRVVKERDRSCIDCGRHDLLEYDHNPDFDATHHTVIDELELRCAPCHQRRHRAA